MSPPSRGLLRGPGAGEGAQCSNSNAGLKKLKKQREGLLNGSGVRLPPSGRSCPEFPLVLPAGHTLSPSLSLPGFHWQERGGEARAAKHR